MDVADATSVTLEPTTGACDAGWILNTGKVTGYVTESVAAELKTELT